MTDATRPRIAFAGTPEFAVPSLRRLAALEVELSLVLTQPDRPAGRGRRVVAPPVKDCALEYGIPVRQPVSLRGLDDFASLWGPAPDVLVVVAYGMLLPPQVLAWPRCGCINVHASVLPRWRGAAPIQRALLAGDPETGVSLMQLERGLDTGPVFAVHKTLIGPTDTAGRLHERLARMGADLLADTLPRILAGTARAVPQDAGLATYAAKIEKHEGQLDWREGAATLERQIRALNPWPGTFACLADGRRLRVHAAEVLPAVGGTAPGDMVAAGRTGMDVATADGVLRLLEIQPPSGRRMSVAAYLAAHSVEGARFV